MIRHRERARTGVATCCLTCLLALAAAPAPAVAQTLWQPLQPNQQTPERQQGPAMASGTEVVLRGLDKVSGEAVDLNLRVGESADYGALTIAVQACRYPAENPSSDAYAFLEITDTRHGERQFRGWMIASSPALNALDHPRFDIWVTRCR